MEALLARMDELVTGLERIIPGAPPMTDWDNAIAFRWRRDRDGGRVEVIARPHRIELAELRGIEVQKSELLRNTRQFVAGLPANNALLWGSRGTGKSSLVKGMLHTFAQQGLRILEVDRHELVDLPDILDRLHGRPEFFVIFCDDLSFDADDPSFRALKAMLDGSLAAAPENVLVYATSNRRHLLPEYMSENLEARGPGGEIHPGEAVEEKISLSERFGIWLSFYPFDQQTYLEIVQSWLERLGDVPREDDVSRVREAALRWALARGSRNGRCAYQFARDWVGKKGLRNKEKGTR